MNQVLTCLWLDQQPFPKTKPCGKQFTVMQDIVRHLNDEHVSRLDNNEYVCYWQNCTRSLLPFKAKYKLVSTDIYFHLKVFYIITAVVSQTEIVAMVIGK